MTVPRAEGAADGLALTVHALPEPVLPDEARTRSGRIKMFVVLLVCAAPVVASYFTYYVVRPQGRANYSTLISPPRPLPGAAELPLADLRGQAVAAASLEGQWLLVVAGGGACDAQCEKLLVLQRQLRETLGKERARVDKVWLVTDDAPLRTEIAAATQQPGAAVTTLRAPRVALARWLAPADGAGLEQHLYVVDPRGEWMMRAPVDPDPAKLRADIERLLRASASWDQPGR